MKNYKILVPFDLQLVLSSDEKEKPYVLEAGVYDVYSDVCCFCDNESDRLPMPL